MKNKASYFYLILGLVIFLAGCMSIEIDSDIRLSATVFSKGATSPQAITSTSVPELVITKLPIITSSSTTTQSSLPIVTPSVTSLPSATATFNTSSVETHTPAPKAQCPQENPSLLPDFTSYLDSGSTVDVPVLDFLNQGGRPEAINIFYKEYFGKKYDLEYKADWVLHADLTGDDVAEVAISELSLMIFGCQEGRYGLLDKVWSGDLAAPPEIVDIKDLNSNGTPEVLIMAWNCGFHPCQDLWVFEWNGKEFISLIGGSKTDPVRPISLFDLELRDIDQNGTIELVFQEHTPVLTVYEEGLPWREVIETYMWNGNKFVVYKSEYASPEYRFQAVQDGDRATLAGEYDKAFQSYQAVIQNNDLDWWTLERKHYEQSLAYDVRKPTPVSTLLPDPKEYPNLAAYAYYRMMILHSVLGLNDKAQMTYETLEDQFPNGEPGHAYVEMAKAFWQEYQISGDTELACTRAIQYASENPVETLYYIGNSEVNEFFQFGRQSLYYHPEDICPFQ